MRNSRQIAIKPRSSRPVPVSPCVFYKIHEGSGSTITDSLGNGPVFTVNTGTPLQTTGGYLPPAPNTTIYAAAPANAFLFSLLSLAGVVGEILIAYDYKSTINAVGAAGWMFQAGVSENNAAADGAIGLGVNTSEGQSLFVRGVGVGTIQNATGTGAPLATTNRVTNLVSIRNPTGGTTADITFMSRRGATYTSNSTTIDIAGGAGNPRYGASDDNGFVIGARQTGVSAFDQYMNGNAGDGATMSHLLMFRSNTLVSGLALAVLNDMHNFAGELPVCLSGI